MTRNIYLGGNIFRPIGAPDLAKFERAGCSSCAARAGRGYFTRSFFVSEAHAVAPLGWCR